MLRLFLVGEAKAGDISLLSNLGVLPWTVSLRTLRALYSSPMMLASGEYAVSPQHDELALSKLMEIVEQRMRMGETTFVEADLAADQIRRLEKLAESWAYSTHLINPGVQAVSHLTISASEVDGLLRGPVEDFTHKYREIVFVGDVHGCVAPLRRLLSKHFDSNKLFVFVGDLFDRGPANGEVFKLIQSLLEKPNVILICGNHERHLLSWMQGRNTPSEFRNNTLPQLFRQGFNRTQAHSLLRQAQHLLQFRFKGSMFQVSHGALANVVTIPGLFPAHQCWRGVGKRTEMIDEAFERNAPADWYQVHGHSNAHGRVISEGQRSFNLEASVEDGGRLGALSFDGTQFKDISVKNDGSGKPKKKKAA